MDDFLCPALHLAALDIFGDGDAWPMTPGLAMTILTHFSKQHEPLLVDVGLRVFLKLIANGSGGYAATRASFAARIVQLRAARGDVASPPPRLVLRPR